MFSYRRAIGSSTFHIFKRQRKCMQAQFATFSTVDNNNDDTLPSTKDVHDSVDFERTSKKFDPTTRRPNQKCDPYGQGGQPMSWMQARNLLTTLDGNWKLIGSNNSDERDFQQRYSSLDADSSQPSIKIDSNQEDGPFPMYLYREFIHLDYITGARLMQKLAAVAQMTAHYPALMQLQRRINNKTKQWQVISTIKCQTLVLGGLSSHDFHLAMMIDVESSRQENLKLWSDSKT